VFTDTCGVIVTDDAGISNVAPSILPELSTSTACPLASVTVQYVNVYPDSVSALSSTVSSYLNGQ
jgi:hypothetical protein